MDACNKPELKGPHKTIGWKPLGFQWVTWKTHGSTYSNSPYQHKPTIQRKTSLIYVKPHSSFNARWLDHFSVSKQYIDCPQPSHILGSWIVQKHIYCYKLDKTHSQTHLGFRFHMTFMPLIASCYDTWWTYAQ